MKNKKSREPKTFDIEQAEFVTETEFLARHLANSSVMLSEANYKMPDWLLNELGEKISEAIRTKDFSFIDRYVRRLKFPLKDASKERVWFFDIHTQNGDLTTFTQGELIQAAKANGFFKNSDDDTIRTKLKKWSKEFGFHFKNSPNKPGGA